MDGFHVEPAKTVRLAESFAGQQQGFETVGRSLARAVDGFTCGDPGIDSQTRAVVARVDSVIAQFGSAFASLAAALDQASADYRTSDEAVAARYLELLPDDETHPVASRSAGQPPVSTAEPTGS